MTRRLILLIAFVVVAAALLFVPLPMSGRTYVERTIENAGHTPLFLIGTLFILSILRHDFRLDGARLYVLAGILGAVAGMLSEIIQRSLRRDASWDDVLADCVGVMLGLALYALFHRRRSLGVGARIAILFVVLACTASWVAPLVSMARAYLYRDGQFPVLASFDSRMELYWIVSFGVRQEVIGGALEVEFDADQSPGVSFHEPVPDWHRYQALELDVENPGSEVLHLGVRVHDAGHGREFADRFNRRFEIAAGERRLLRIPLDEIRRGPRNRLMNMAQISNISVYRARGAGSELMRLHSMRLD